MRLTEKQRKVLMELWRFLYDPQPFAVRLKDGHYAYKTPDDRQIYLSEEYRKKNLLHIDDILNDRDVADLEVIDCIKTLYMIVRGWL